MLDRPEVRERRQENALFRALAAKGRRQRNVVGVAGGGDGSEIKPSLVDANTRAFAESP
jgi:hypothetical protein